jgi:hypothetical protein
MTIIRRCSLPLITFLIFSSGISFSQQGPAQLASLERIPEFSETFEGNTSIWITDNQYLSGKILNGLYTIKCKNYKSATGLSYIPVEIDQSKDFEIEASIKIIRGTGGLVFGMDERYNHYRVEFTDKTELFVAKTSSTIDKLFTGTRNPNVKPGTFNKVVVSKLGSIYYVFINDVFVKEFDNIKLDGNRIGFNVGLNSEISIDHLKVSYLQPKAAPATASNSNPTPVILDQKSTLEDNEITWISPSSESTTVDIYSAPVRARVRSKFPLTKAIFYLNNIPVGEAIVTVESEKEGLYRVERIIDLKSGNNHVHFIATNSAGETQSSSIRNLINPKATKPVITWSIPNKNSYWNSERIDIEACIKSPSNLISVDVIVNGDSRGKDRVFERSNNSSCDFVFRRTVMLKQDFENSISIIAENEAGAETSDPISIIYQKSIVEKRIALVIGNSDYNNKTPLKNPVNDANLMAATLEELDFEVIKRTDASLKDMRDAIIEFNQKLDSFNVALFYYAGHGVQVDGTNYLLPTDAKIETRNTCEFESISLSDVVNQLKRNPDNTNIVILDACRDNPYREWARGSGDGFKFLPSVSGTIIGYATAEGAKAEDGAGVHGLYTEELVKQMKVFQPIESVFKKTMVEVEKRTNFRQSPQVTLGLRGDFYFKRQ